MRTSFWNFDIRTKESHRPLLSSSTTHARVSNMSTLHEKDWREKEKNSVLAFYAGRSIFVTGSTGFLGKVLIEKLLRSCTDVREIFLLLRPKKGLSPEERIKKMTALPLFDKLRNQNPSALEKLIAIPGDTSLEGLGISEADRQTLIDRVSVIFHVAANVRFEEDLKKDILSNVRSIRDICILGKSMKNLVVLEHVSTAYSQCDKHDVEEILYPALTDWRDAIQMAETLDEYIINTITAKYICPMPNTYTFSKRLAEAVIEDYSKELPIVLARPSIVISTMDEPEPGWIDNFNGPVGLLTAGGKGVVRIVPVRGEIVNDYIPVDVIIKAMVVAAWKRGIRPVTEDSKIDVYNCATYMVHRSCLAEIIEMGFKIIRNIPLEGIIWYPRTLMSANPVKFYILTLLLHLLPSFFFDGMLSLSGNKPILRRLYMKIYHASQRLRYFMTQEWNFHNYKMLQLLQNLPPSEFGIFDFKYDDFDYQKFYTNAVVGVKRFLLHETGDLEAAKRHYNRLMWLDRIFNSFLLVLTMWIFSRVGLFAYIAAQFQYLAYGSFLHE